MNQAWLSRTAAIYLTKCSCFMSFHSSAGNASTVVIRRPFAHIQWYTNFLITFINPSGVPICHIILRHRMEFMQPGILIAASSSSVIDLVWLQTDTQDALLHGEHFGNHRSSRTATGVTFSNDWRASAVTPHTLKAEPRPRMRAVGRGRLHRWDRVKSVAWRFERQ